MVQIEALGVFLGAIALGFVHGIEPGHGWPVAAAYALDQTNKWLYGFAASFILGVGHLISSIAMVGVFFYAKEYFNLTQINEPTTMFGSVQIGGPVSLVAGVLLIALGLREYFRGGHFHDTGGHSNSDDHRHEHDHDHSGNGGSHEHHDHSNGGVLARIKDLIPFVGSHSHSHSDEGHTF